MEKGRALLDCHVPVGIYDIVGIAQGGDHGESFPQRVVVHIAGNPDIGSLWHLEFDFDAIYLLKFSTDVAQRLVLEMQVA